MNVGFFIVRSIIFAIYVAFLIWNIFYSHRKQREENYPNLKRNKVTDKTKTSQVYPDETDNKDGL